MARATKAPWIPRAEILRGELDDAVFGVDFEAVVEGKGPRVYSDAKLFEQNTYPTEGLKAIVKVVFDRLANPKEAGAALRLSTGFGGGKTHSLIALLHLARNARKSTYFNELLPAANRPGKVAIAAIDIGKAGLPDFASHDKVTTRSLWCEIAYWLHNRHVPKELVAVDDLEKQPNARQLERIFPEGPVLVLLDEPVKYLAMLSERQKNSVYKFLDTFVSAVRNRPQTVLVITDPGDQPAYQLATAELTKWLAAAKSLGEILGRKDGIIDPVGKQTASVIRRRLFEYVDEKKAPQLVSAEFLAAYKRVTKQHPGRLPAEASTAKYAERIVECYPFHPRLIETLQDRLGGMQMFQRSRGVLRLLAKVLRDLHDRDIRPKLISAGDINWLNPSLRAELLDRMNKASLSAAVTADVERHAGELDGGAEAGPHRRVASALLLESLPDQSSGLSPEDLTLAVLRPDEEGTEPADALKTLTDVAWHTHQTPGGRWRFQYEANVNRMVEERMAKVEPEDARARVRSRAQDFFRGTIFKPANWPLHPHDVRDDAMLQLVVCDSVERAQRVLAFRDDTDPEAPQPRAYRNGIFAVCPTGGQLDEAVQRTRRLMAAELVKRQLQEEKNKPALAQLDFSMDALAKLAKDQIHRALNQLVLSNGSVSSLPEELLVPDEGRALGIVSGQAGLQRYLVEKKLLFTDDEKLDPLLFTTRLLPGATPVIGQQGAYSTQAVKERLYSAPDLRLIPGDRFIKNTILAAVQAGKLVVRTADGSAWDKTGCVSGAPGKRQRTSNRLDLAHLQLDKDTLVALASGSPAAEWLKEDKVEPGGKTKHPPLPPPGEDSAEDWETAVKLAGKKKLRSLRLVTTSVADHAAVVALLPALGAEEIAVSTSISAQQLKGGGSARLAFNGLKLQSPLRVQEMAEKVMRAADGQPTYWSEFALGFGEGRAGMAGALRALSDGAPEGVSIRAEFA